MAGRLVVSMWFGVLLATGCDSGEPKCDVERACAPDGAGGSSGDGASGGSGGETGQGGSGGSGGASDTSWSEVRPVACTDEQGSRVVSTNLFADVFQVLVSPRLEEGFSDGATVLGHEENMTVILLRTDGGKSVRIKWPGVIGDFSVDEEIVLEQTRDWTILRKTGSRFAAAMYQRNGAIPVETLDPLPLDGPTLRFAMQCNMQDDAFCTLDAVALETSDGLQTFESGTIVPFGNWTISNRSALQSPNCQGNVQFRSLIWAHGG